VDRERKRRSGRLGALSRELTELQRVLQHKARDPEHEADIGLVAAAAGDDPRVSPLLGQGTKWLLDVVKEAATSAHFAVIEAPIRRTFVEEGPASRFGGDLLGLRQHWA
jgi:hypothetical protein